MKNLYLKGNKIYAKRIENIFTKAGINFWNKNRYLGYIKEEDGKIYFKAGISSNLGVNCLKNIIKILEKKEEKRR